MDANPPPDTQNWLVNPVLWAAGLAGAMVSLAHTKGLSIGQRLMTLLVGVLTAAFLTPVVAEKAKFGVNEVAACGFFLGLAGMMLTATAVNVADKSRNDPGYLIDLWRRFRGLPVAAPPAGVTVSVPVPVPQIAPPPPPTVTVGGGASHPDATGGGS